MLNRWAFKLLALVLVLGTVSPAAAQMSLDQLAERAARLKPSPPRYIQNLKFGVRGVIFRHFDLSKSDPDSMYVASFDGFVFGSRDGGLSWREGRLTTQRQFFYGSLRPDSSPNGAPFSINSVFQKAAKGSFLNYNTGNMFRFSYGSTGEPFLDVQPDGAEFSPIRSGLTSRFDAGRVSLYDQAGGGGGGGDMARLGVGLTRSAVFLQALLKKRRARLIGMNLKLLLSLRGLEPTWVNHVAIHPTDPDISLSATGMGLYRTTDGGLGWQHTFPGRNSRERWCNFVSYHPTDPNVIFLGTDQGLLISRDGGEKFARPTGTQLSTAATRWVEFYKGDPDIIYAGTKIGGFRSDDGGKNWRWIYYETLPTQNFVTAIAIDPEDADRVTFATKDGLFKTENGGKKWIRSGGLMFTSIPVWRMAGDPKDGKHIVAATMRNIWETFDWGKTWSALYINDSEWAPRAVAFDHKDPDVFWVLTSGELLRISSKPPKQAREDALARVREIIQREPQLPQVLDAAFKHYGVHRGRLSKMRKNSRFQALMPKFNVFAGFIKVKSDADLLVNLNLNDQAQKLTLQRFEPGGQLPYYGAMLNWNLSNLVFYFEEAPYGRYFRQNNAIYMRLKFEIQRLFEERKRILVQLATVERQNTQSRLSFQLRLEELTAHLDAHTGGLYQAELKRIEAMPFVSQPRDPDPVNWNP